MAMDAEFRKKLFTLSKLKGVGPATLTKLLTIPSLSSLSISDVAAKNTKVAKALEKPGAWDDANSVAESDWEKASNRGARILCVLDDEYPELLRATPDKPFFIYILGRLSNNPSQSVAVIGTREPTDHGKIMGERITGYLVNQGWSIVSGLAIGCDTVAHEKALAEGGHTVAVLAHGLHTVAPKQNEKLADRIVSSGGALVTEYAFGVEPYGPQFVKRDRIQAGLSRGVVLIQSDLEGGSLHASRAAIDYQRLLAVASPTERDVASCEPKIGANRILAGDDEQGKAKLLKCDQPSLKRLFVIRNKDDYPGLLDRLRSQL
jgi:DNA processing protein